MASADGRLDEDFLALIGARIRERRRIAGLTVQELADRAGISRRLMTQIEHGQANPSLVTVTALARALGREAGLLLLDEPFGNVDRLTRQDLIGRLREHLGKGVAALIVTHDPVDAEDLASRVLLLRQGRLVGDGESVAQLREQGRWERELLG